VGGLDDDEAAGRSEVDDRSVAVQGGEVVRGAVAVGEGIADRLVPVAGAVTRTWRTTGRPGTDRTTGLYART
jgi:hypothetical protein